MSNENEPKPEPLPATPSPGIASNQQNDEPPVEVVRTEVTVKVNPVAEAGKKP